MEEQQRHTPAVHFEDSPSQRDSHSQQPQTPALEQPRQAQRCSLAQTKSELDSHHDAPTKRSDFEFLHDFVVNHGVYRFLVSVSGRVSDCAMLICGCVLYIFVQAMSFHFYKEMGVFTIYLQLAVPLAFCFTYAFWKPFRMAFPVVMRKQEDGRAVNALPSGFKTKLTFIRIVLCLTLVIPWASAWR
jgi:hypothetical protein